ncbi:MAG: hypothetical protein EPN25_05065 [Nitrospirae bacterium]|nr:MAG: hypothetical protein EPN25_05065 [Nitrospirota bacterium]
MKRPGINIMVVLTALLVMLSLAACASNVALLRSSAAKTFQLDTADYDTAFSKVTVAAKDLGYSITTENREKGTFFLSRGYGYSEYTNMEIRIVRDEAGLKMDLVAKSSQNGESVINDFMTAYRKYIRTK